MRTFPLLAMALLGLAVLAPQLGADPPVTRHYPIDELVRTPRELQAQRIGFYAAEERAEDAGQDELDTEALTELVLAVSGDDWERPHSARARDGWLVVCHTEAIQARVASLLSALREHRVRQIAIAIETYRLARPAAELVLTGGPALDAKRLAALEGAEKVGSQVLVGRVGHKLVASRVIHESFGVDVSVEIAQRSTQSYLERMGLATGQVAQVRALAGSDGRSMLVACSLDRSARMRETPRATIVLDATNTIEVDQPRHAQEGVLTQVVLQSGGAAVLAAWGDAEGTQVVIARHVAGNVQVDDAELRKAGLGAWDARLLLYNPSAPAATQLGAGLFDASTQASPTISLSAGPFSDGDDLLDALQTEVSPAAWESSDNFLRLHEQVVVARAPADVLEAVGVWLAKREQALTRGGLLRGEVVVATGPAAAALAARVGQPVAWEGLMPEGAASEGITALAVVARRHAVSSQFEEAYYIEGYQTEVAEGAGILDPEMRLYRAGRTFRVDAFDAVGNALACNFELGSARLDGVEQRAMREGVPYARPRIVKGLTHGRVVSGQATLLDLGDDRFLWVACDATSAP